MKPVVVITRFNIASRYRYNKLYKNIENDVFLFLDENYLKRRFEIFEKYCYASFKSQIDKDFRWIVLFHKDTPISFKRLIEKYSEEMEQFEPWFLDDNDSERFVDVLKEDFKKNYQNDGLITVRVDNDDSVHKTFIQKIKNNLDNKSERTILSFKNGLQYDVRTKHCVKYSYVNNHFISLATNVGDLDINIFSFQHPDVDSVFEKKNKLVLKEKVPMWVEVISETNCVNEIWTRPSKIFIPFDLCDEYPQLEVKWSNKSEWILMIIKELPISMLKMIRDIVKLAVIKVS